MKKIIQIVVAVVVIASMAGCATTKAYFTDRGRDAADIFTVSIGTGVGVSAKTGPVHVGLFAGLDHVGLRGGQMKYKWSQELFEDCGILFDPLIAFPGPDGFSVGEEGFSGSSDQQSTLGKRGKLYVADGVCPFVMMPSKRHGGEYPYYYFTQCELAIGLGLDARVGFNPGELLDFVLGWTTVDIFADDLNAIKQKEESNQPSHGTR